MLVLKEKAGIERAIISGQLALYHRHGMEADTPEQEDENFHVDNFGVRSKEKKQHLFANSTVFISDGIPLSLMVGLREVVAQQEGYRTAFFRFAPRWAADTYREHRREACVVESLRMRAILLRPLRKALGVSIVEEDGDWSRVAGRVTKDDWEESTELERDFTMVDW